MYLFEIINLRCFLKHFWWYAKSYYKTIKKKANFRLVWISVAPQNYHQFKVARWSPSNLLYIYRKNSLHNNSNRKTVSFKSRGWVSNRHGWLVPQQGHSYYQLLWHQDDKYIYWKMDPPLTLYRSYFATALVSCWICTHSHSSWS